MRVVSQVWHIGTFLKMYIELGKCIKIENGHLLYVPKLPVSYVHIQKVFYSKKINSQYHKDWFIPNYWYLKVIFQSQKIYFEISIVWDNRILNVNKSTVQILCIGTDRSQQTVQTKIRLLLKKQSDQGLCCLPFHQHLLDALMQCYIKLFYF